MFESSSRGPTNNSDVLIEALEDWWKRFSQTWKLAKYDCGESEIHDLRVASRRFTSVLALLDSAFQDIGADDARRKFKKVLKQLGGLRDAQVQLLRAKDIPNNEVPRAFLELLENKVVSESNQVSSFLAGRSVKLRRRLGKLEVLLGERLDETASSKLNATLTREIKARHSVFASTRSLFVRGGQDHLHAMRIALKNLRYGLEGAAPLVNFASKKELAGIRDLQKELGNLRDLRIFITSLAEWAENQGATAKHETKALCDRFGHQYISAVTSLQSSPELNGNLLPARLRKPASRAQRAVERELTVAAIVSDEPAAAPKRFEPADGNR